MMREAKSCIRYLAAFVLLVICALPNANAQRSHRKFSKRDSLRRSILRRDSMMRTFKRSDTSINDYLQKVEYYNASFNQIKNNLGRDIDTAEISDQLPKIEKRVTLVKKLISDDQSSTLRYLYTIRDLLTRSDEQLDGWQDQLSDLNDKLVQSQSDLSQMHKDSMLRVLPSDTSMVKTFMQQKIAIYRKWRKLDSLDKLLLTKVGLLQNRVTSAYISVLDQTDQIDQKIRAFGERALSCETGYIWQAPTNKTATFKDAFNRSFTMNSKLFSIMITRDVVLHICAGLLFVLFLVWTGYNRRKVLLYKEQPHEVLSQTTYLAKYPFVSAFLLVTAIAPNFYNHPPVVFIEAFALLMFITVLYLVKKTQERPVFIFLLQLFVITLFYSASNLFVKVSEADRVIVLILAGLSAAMTIQLQKKLQGSDDFLPHSRFIIRVFIILQVISFVLNVFGRFSLAKIIGFTAVYNLWLGLGLYMVVQILMESLFLQLEANKSNQGISSYIDFNVLQKKLRRILNFGATIVWLIMLAQNLSIEDGVFDWISEVLTTSHTVGGTGTFTFGSIIIFVAVIWLSSIVARLISYIYDFADQHRSAPLFKKKTRTSILVVKIAVFAIGFLLAVAASGVPLDKVTIIISAFGVGIGFGLQNIVNNLVSGLILAFERPVQIGDIIEVDNKSGTIKEIGIRSSRIVIGNGAELIVPNGDLISNHVINWTLSDSNRQVALKISVAYGSDIKQVEQLLRDVLKDREDIMSTPAPSVLLQNLSESSIEFKVSFWADEIGNWERLKSDVLADIYATLRKEGIGLPYTPKEISIHLADKKSDEKPDDQK